MLTTRLTSLTQHDAWNEICCLCPFQSLALLLCIASPERAGRLRATSKPAIIQAGRNSQLLLLQLHRVGTFVQLYHHIFPGEGTRTNKDFFLLQRKKGYNQGLGNTKNFLALWEECLWRGEVWFDLSVLLSTAQLGNVLESKIAYSKFCTHFAQVQHCNLIGNGVWQLGVVEGASNTFQSRSIDT